MLNYLMLIDSSSIKKRSGNECKILSYFEIVQDFFCEGEFAKIVVVDDSGYIIAAEDCSTDTRGVWAAGDTRTKPLRQIVTAASDGAVAATAASAYIIKKRKSK